MRPFPLQNDGLAALILKKRFSANVGFQDHRKYRPPLTKRQQLITEGKYDTMLLTIDERMYFSIPLNRIGVLSSLNTLWPAQCIKQIVDLLKVLHIPSPTGKEIWCQKSVDDILSNEKYVGDVVLMKTIRIGGPGSKRIKNRGEAAQYKATASHQAIITREQFEAAQRERERRCNVEGNGVQRVRKSTRYKSTFSIDKYLSTIEE